MQITDSIIREHTQTTVDPAEDICRSAIDKGLNACSLRRAQDMYEQRLLQELTGKLALLQFTNRYVKKRFSISVQAARAKIQGWMNSGAVAQTGTRQVEDADKSLHEYSVIDPRLARIIEQDLAGGFEFVL